MSKRKKADPNPEEEEEDDDDDDTNSHDKSRQQEPQKVYDFHKKTIEVYPERLRELNRQFSSSISSQITTEPYSVLVGNCLDYVRQYFKYEDDFLQYSPWLATRLKQSRSDIVKCLQETIDVYEALARHDFDRIVNKNNNETSSDDSITNKIDSSAQSTTPSFQFRPSTTTGSTLPLSKPTTTTTASDSTPITSFSFAKSTTTTPTSDSTPLTSFGFSKSTATTTTTANDYSTPSTGFSFGKSAASATTNDYSTPSTGFSFAKPPPTTTTASSGSAPTSSFSFKMPTTTASPEKSANTSPFAFSIPSTGFGTSTFSSPSFGNPTSTEKSSISFAPPPPPNFSFAPTPSAGGEQQGTTEDNEDESNEPPEPEKVDHESDAKLTYRCRMGVNKSGKLIKRGPVQVILKEANEKHQLIVRSDDTLGRLYLNIIWSKSIEMKKNSTKDLTFVCALNPGMPEVKEGEFVMILLRFDNETDRNDAYEKLNKERT